jgi:PA14 domain
MTGALEELEPSLTSADVEGLFRAARLLLRQHGHLDALRLVHADIEDAIRGPASARTLPGQYSSYKEAWQQQSRLRALWAERSLQGQPAGKLRKLLRRRPYWFSRAAVAGVVVLLTIRYAVATKYADWHRQHPEGDWVSRFYPSPDFQGYPLVRYDMGVNYDFGSHGAADNMPKENFSARWDTCLIVAQDVKVALQLDSDDGSKLWLDGVLQMAVDPGPGGTSAEVSLRQGVRHLSLDLIERTGTAMIRLQGLELEGTDAYRFQRPVFDGVELRCK